MGAWLLGGLPWFLDRRMERDTTETGSKISMRVGIEDDERFRFVGSGIQSSNNTKNFEYKFERTKEEPSQMRDASPGQTTLRLTVCLSVERGPSSSVNKNVKPDP